ncbi:MAG: hypothetical protein ACRBFS_19615 [Aureispira sp.]
MTPAKAKGLIAGHSHVLFDNEIWKVKRILTLAEALPPRRPQYLLESVEKGHLKTIFVSASEMTWLKQYPISLLFKFPKPHQRKGQLTNFITSYHKGTKIHTIRLGYDNWARRIKEIQEGKAVLSVYTWSGTPYKSKQIKCFQLTRHDGVGVERAEWTKCPMRNCHLIRLLTDNSFKNIATVAPNDGLSESDFLNWFDKTPIGQDLSIIHFTKFRYDHRSTKFRFETHCNEYTEEEYNGIIQNLKT